MSSWQFWAVRKYFLFPSLLGGNQVFLEKSTRKYSSEANDNSVLLFVYLCVCLFVYLTHDNILFDNLDNPICIFLFVYLTHMNVVFDILDDSDSHDLVNFDNLYIHTNQIKMKNLIQ